MSTNHNARSVAIEIENLAAAEVMMLIEPVLQGEVSEDVVGAGPEDKLGSEWG